MTNITLRGAAAALECVLPERSSQSPPSESRRENMAATGNPAGAGGETGRIAIEAIDSVFALDARRALILATGSREPAPFVARIEWTGHGSLVTLATPLAAGRAAAAAPARELAEDELQFSGLVRGEVEFEGAAPAGPEAAQVRRWQAPLRSNQAPGIGAGELSLPRVE